MHMNVNNSQFVFKLYKIYIVIYVDVVHEYTPVR